MFGMFSRKDINKGVEDFKNTKGAVLLDVRSEEEYNEYRIEGSLNIPLHRLSEIHDIIQDMTTPIFIYCLSGARSAQAEAELKRAGYKNAVNIGGIGSYRGKTV